GGVRSVLEDVTQVAVTAGTEDLGSDHAVGVVDFRGHVLLGHGPEETRPASAGVELGVRGEQRQATADAGVDALTFVVQQGAAEGTLRALTAGNADLLGRQLLRPLLIRLGYPGGFDGTDQLSLAVEHFHLHGRLPRWFLGLADFNNSLL